MVKTELKDKLKNATSNTVSTQAKESISSSSASIAENLEDSTKAAIDATAKQIAVGLVTNQAAEQIHQKEEENGAELSTEEAKASARAYIKNTLDSAEFYDALSKDISESLTSWLDSAAKNSLGDYSTMSSAMSSISSKFTVANDISFKIMSTTADMNEKLSALEKNEFIKVLFNGTAVADTSDKLHSLFSKIGIKGGDNIINYISNKVIGTMSGEKFLKTVFGDESNIKNNIQNFQNYINQITETITKINEVVAEIQNQIYSVAQNAIATVLNTVKTAISAVVDNVVTAAIGTLKDSLSDAWKAGSGEAEEVAT